MVWLIIIGLLGYSVYEFVGAVAMVWSIVPFVLVLPFVAVHDIRKWFVTRERRARSAARFRAWRDDLRERVVLHQEMFPGDDRDENGIRFDYGISEQSDDRPAVRPARRWIMR